MHAIARRVRAVRLLLCRCDHHIGQQTSSCKTKWPSATLWQYPELTLHHHSTCNRHRHTCPTCIHNSSKPTAARMATCHCKFCRPAGHQGEQANTPHALMHSSRLTVHLWQMMQLQQSPCTRVGNLTVSVICPRRQCLQDHLLGLQVCKASIRVGGCLTQQIALTKAACSKSWRALCVIKHANG